MEAVGGYFYLFVFLLFGLSLEFFLIFRYCQTDAQTQTQKKKGRDLGCPVAIKKNQSSTMAKTWPAHFQIWPDQGWLPPAKKTDFGSCS